MRRIGSGTSNRVQDAPGGTAVLWRISIRNRLELLHRALRDRKCEHRALTAADSAEKRLIVIRAIHDHVAIDTSLAKKAQLIPSSGIGLNCRSQCGKVLETAAIDRQIPDHL